jgi:Asp-tRNA(Asn)/Glu-tRNA(Gln) amidotransferase A subunit family amidase
LRELIFEPITTLSERVRTGEISPVELTKACLEEIERTNPTLNAFITVSAESALAASRQAEAEIRRGNWRGRLHGIPIGLKDLIDTRGVLTTAASALFENRIPDADATVVGLLRAAGAVFLGKQNMHEFAYGASSVVSHYGAVRNPWNPDYIAGGSSGGSAAAVAAGLCCAAIGTDTAGSIREPSALSGVVGLKPTYGLVSAEGVFPLSVSLDHVGAITRSVSDAALLLEAMTGALPGTYARQLGRPSRARDSAPPPSLGIPRAFFFAELDAEVSHAAERALFVLEGLTGSRVELDLTVDTDRTLQSGEAWAVHAGFLPRNAHLYQPETLRRLRSGEHISPSDLAARRRDLAVMRDEIQQVFARVDLMVTPTTPVSAPSLLELEQDPDNLRPRELILLRNTRPVNVWGLPAISVPCGFTSSGLPIGLQIIGGHGQEAKVFELAQAYEEATSWHLRSPDPCPRPSSPTPS